MRYKIGDKVKILRSAVEIDVWPSEVGQIGVIVHDYGNRNKDFDIKTKNGLWYVRHTDISPVNIIGKQMVF